MDTRTPASGTGHRFYGLHQFIDGKVMLRREAVDPRRAQPGALLRS